VGAIAASPVHLAGSHRHRHQSATLSHDLRCQAAGDYGARQQFLDAKRDVHQHLPIGAPPERYR
jgi:hypothetical protein